MGSLLVQLMGHASEMVSMLGTCIPDKARHDEELYSYHHSRPNPMANPDSDRVRGLSPTPQNSSIKSLNYIAISLGRD